jgi:hypothetical protein
VYGGYLETAAVLLEGGADVNLNVANMYEPSQTVDSLGFNIVAQVWSLITVQGFTKATRPGRRK